MKIKLARHAGFCFGVKRAVNLALSTVQKNGRKNIYTLGPLIHNPQVILELEGKGIRNMAPGTRMRSGIVLVCSHGMHPDILAGLRRKKVRVVDATCPFVKKIENIVVKLKTEKIPIIIVGDKDHPEVKAITGYAGRLARVVESAAEAQGLPRFPKIGVVAQTTQSEEKFAAVCRILKKKAAEARVFNTICDATKKRQHEALKVARQVEKIVVVGGYNSANTKRLVNLCRELGKPTLHIEEAGELPGRFFRGVKKVGVLAGASTPDWIINEVISKIKKMEEE
jgi:4-hydroxy-3-methylbut-2-enyl diphosphate reductase